MEIRNWVAIEVLEEPGYGLQLFYRSVKPEGASWYREYKIEGHIKGMFYSEPFDGEHDDNKQLAYESWWKIDSMVEDEIHDRVRLTS